MKKISALIAVCSLGLAAQAQLIDPLTGGLAGYTTTLANDVSHGPNSVSFTSTGSGLSASYVGTGANVAEQALLLAPVSSFSTTFTPGHILWVNVSVPVSSIAMDLGLAVASTATPTAASAGNSWDSRKTFDWASINIRPSQAAVRGSEAISGTLNTSFNTAAAANTVSQLYINWISTDVFTLGYADTSAVNHDLYTATFAGASTIGTAIGFYGDLRNTATTLGNFNNLTITPAPEPSSLALCGVGLAGLVAVIRRKK